MNIELSVSDLCGKTGTWETKFTLDKSKQKLKTTEVKINEPIEVAGVPGKIVSAVISPLTVKINASGDFNKPDDPFFAFIVFDDKGNMLTLENGGGDAKSSEANYISDDNMKSITIIPAYSTKLNKDTSKLPAVKLDMNKFKPLVLRNNNDSCINITNYFMDGDYLIVKYNQEYFGKGTGYSWFSLPVYVTADGKEIKGDDEESYRVLDKYYNYHENVRVFKIGSSRNIMIGTYDDSNVKIMKDKSYTIKIKKYQRSKNI